MSAAATTEREDHCIAALYRAAFGSETWEKALGDTVDLVGAADCQFVAIDKASGRIATTLYSQHANMDGVLEYVREYHKIDPHAQHALGLPPGEVFNSSEVLPANTMAQHPFYRDFWAAYDFQSLVGGKVLENDAVVALFGLFRTAKQGPFPASALALVRRVFFHLGHAFAIHLQSAAMRGRANVAGYLLDHLSRPTFLLDAQRYVVHANPAGQALLRSGAGLVSRSGYLGCEDAGDERDLMHKVAGLLKAPPARAAIALKGPAGQRTAVCIWALPADAAMGIFGDAPRLMLIFDAPGKRPDIDPFMVASAYDLTPAEARVAVALASGRVPKQVAADHGVAVTTIRTQIRSLYQKLGIGSDTELVAMLNAAPFAVLG